MHNETHASLKKFIVKETGVKIQEITSDAELENDLGIFGDDALELIIAFSKKFNVDISNFMAKDYISAEGDNICQ